MRDIENYRLVEWDKLDNLPANAIDELLTIETNLADNVASTSLNTAKVTNANHTWEVAGSSGLVAQPEIISNKAAIAVLDWNEELLLNKGGVLRKTTIQDALNLSIKVDSVNSQTWAVILDADDISPTATNKYTSTWEKTKIGFISVTQAVDLDQMEIDIAANTTKIGITPTHIADITANNTKISYTDSAAVALNTAKETNIAHPLVETAVPVGALFTDTDTIYDDTAIQADVTVNTAKLTANTANVTAAWALMDSEVVNLAEVKAFDSTDYAVALWVNDNYVTDAEKVVIWNTSGTNTGDRNITEVEIDVGSLPVLQSSIAVVDAGVTTSSHIVGGVAYKQPTGKDLDELDMDSFDLKFEATAGGFNIHIKGLDWTIAGTFIIWYTYT
jgi:hypothetical protein